MREKKQIGIEEKYFALQQPTLFHIRLSNYGYYLISSHFSHSPRHRFLFMASSVPIVISNYVFILPMTNYQIKNISLLYVSNFFFHCFSTCFCVTVYFRSSYTCIVRKSISTTVLQRKYIQFYFSLIKFFFEFCFTFFAAAKLNKTQMTNIV